MSKKSLMSKLTARMFTRVAGIQWSLLTGQAGFTTKQGDLATLGKQVVGEGENAVVSYHVDLCPISSVGIPVPAYAIATPLEKIEEGDLVCGADEVRGWVTKVHPQSLEIMKADGCHTRITPPKASFMGNNGLLVVRSLTTLLGGDAAATGFQSMLMPLLMARETGSTEDLTSLMLMSQMAGGTAEGANPMAAMLPMMLLNKGGSSLESLIPLLMMPQMAGGAAGANPAMAMLPMLMLSKGETDLDEVIPFLLMAHGAGGSQTPGMDMQTLMLVQALKKGDNAAVIAGKPELQEVRVVPTLERI